MEPRTGVGVAAVASVTGPSTKQNLKDIDRVRRRKVSVHLRTRVPKNSGILQDVAPPLTYGGGPILEWLGKSFPLQVGSGDVVSVVPPIPCLYSGRNGSFLASMMIKSARNMHIRLAVDSQVIVHCLNRESSKTRHKNHDFAILILA